MTISTVIPLRRTRWRPGQPDEDGERLTAEETPVAIVHDGSTTAVLMATPANLDEFGIGFSLSEGVIDRPEDVRSLEVVETELGIEVRLWLAGDYAARLAARRRHMAGPTGCGLCGIESLEEACRTVAHLPITGGVVRGEELMEAMAALTDAQLLGRQTRAAHAAALWRRGADLIVREDVGRHNALDKLIGATASLEDRDQGVLLLTSRVSVDMVQKAAVLGAPVICAVSAPTALAVRTGDAAGLTLVGVARADGMEIFTHPGRLIA